MSSGYGFLWQFSDYANQLLALGFAAMNVHWPKAIAQTPIKQCTRAVPEFLDYFARLEANPELNKHIDPGAALA